VLHNRLLAEATFGKEHVAAAIEARQGKRDEHVAAAASTGDQPKDSAA
jgi:hypothetical protein